MRRWYNNGVSEIQVVDDGKIPEGFVPGRKAFSQQAKDNMRKSQLTCVNPRFSGRTHSEESKSKTSKTLLDKHSKGEINVYHGHPWNYGTKGAQVPWNKGISYYATHTEEDKQRMVEKIYQTKKKNRSFNKSQPEEDFYKVLTDMFDVDDVERNYYSDRYPFRCDFYIKPLDLFIELNFHPSHNGCMYDSTNPDHIKQKRILESKNDDWSNMILGVWCNRDVMKVNCAKQNNLDYHVCYSEEEVQRLSKLLQEKKYLLEEKE